MNPTTTIRPTRSPRIAWAAIFGFAAAVAATTAPVAVHAQTAWPTKAITIVVPFPAGTSPDVVARTYGERLAKALGQAVIVDNRPGATTIIGAQAVHSAPADGYTLLYTAQNTVSINPYVFKNLPYKVDDFVPVTQVVTVPLVLVTSASSPIKSLQDLVSAAKAKPGKLSFSSYGIGQGTHVLLARLMNTAGITMAHVPYRDGGIVDVMSGVIDVGVDPSTTSIQTIRGGKLRGLAVSSAKRLAALPDVPTVAETYPGFVADSWTGVLVRKGTPPQVVAKLAAESQKIVAMEDFRAKMREYGLTPRGGTPAEFAAFIATESRVWAQVVKDNDIKAD